MSDPASIRFHNVKHCGLYKPNARNATLSSFKDLLQNVNNWTNAGGRHVLNTCTYEVSHNFDMDFLKTFILNCYHDKSTGDYFMLVWNQTHDSGDSAYAIDQATTVGNISQSSIHKGNFPKTSIPGFATYFWFIPEKSSMATISFGTPRTGIKALQYWLEQFFYTESRYAKFDGNDRFLGFAKGNDAPQPDLRPRITRQLHKNPSKRDVIVNNRQHIKSIIRRINLDRTEIPQEDALEKLLRLTGISETSATMPHTIPLTYEFKYTPSKEELESIISEYEKADKLGGWADIGFSFPRGNTFGAEEKEWLSKSFAKTKISIDSKWLVPGEIVDFSQLITEINKNRKELLKVIS